MTRHIFIGDIQGCREELEALLDKCGFDATEDLVLPVGDLVNRGPDNLGTLRLLQGLGAMPVLGNHDLHLIRVAAGTRQLKDSDTFGDILNSDDREALIGWLREQPFAREIAGNLMVHAGLHPGWDDPVSRLAVLDPREPHPDSDFSTRVRTCDSFGLRPEEQHGAKAGPFKPWHHFIQPVPGRTIVFGHWAAQGLFVESGFRGLDSGCVWGNRLSAWIAEEDRIVQTPAARSYCER